MKNPRSKSILLILFSALMFGSYGVWSRLIGTGYGIFYPGWTRSLIIAVALFPILLLKREIVPIKKTDFRWMSAFLIFTAFTQAPLLYAYNHMDIGSATLLFFVSMLLTMYGFGFAFFGEKLTLVKSISFLVALIGLYFIFSFSLATFAVLASCMAVANGIASGGEVSSSKKLTGSYSALYLSWLSWIFIALTNFAISFFAGESHAFAASGGFWFFQCLYALVGVAGFWAVMQGFKYVEPSIGGLLGLLEIVFSIAFGMLIFHQALTMKVAIGALLIICAAALPHIFELAKRGRTARIAN